MEKQEQIKKLLEQKRKLEEELENINFKGYPEIKVIAGKKYIYLRHKRYDHLSSKYAGVYTESFYNDLKSISSSVRLANSQLRSINLKLAKLGIDVNDLPSSVYLNLDFIRSNLNNIIYGQAIVEGVSATFSDTEEILERGSSKNVSFDDTLTILNLKNAWQYVLDEDTIRMGVNFFSLCNIAGFVNDRQISYPNQLRSTNVRIGGSSYRPPLPIKEEVIKTIDDILVSSSDEIMVAINLLCYLTKAQLFANGNKRTALIFANLYLLSRSMGYISVSDKDDKKYKKLLVEYYEEINDDVKSFLYFDCYKKLK